MLSGVSRASVVGTGPYSFSGVRLEGDRLVRLVFMDEAGLSKPEHEPFIVVAGVIIHADNSLNGVESQLERIMRRRIPARHWDGFVFHAMELFNGGGKVFKRQKDDFIGPPEWPLHRRLEIAEEIMSIPKKFSLPIAIGFVEKAKFAKDFESADLGINDKTLAGHAIAFTSCSVFIEQWMRLNAKNENCLLVVEQNERARTLIRTNQRWNQDKKAVEILDEAAKKFFPFRKIRQDPLFQDKQPSSALIVSDFCAYVVKKGLVNDERYRGLYDLIRKNIIFFEDEDNPFLVAQSA
jgi:hypothetical protein